MNDYAELKERLRNITFRGTPKCAGEAIDAITALEARVAELEAERAEWFQPPMLTMGKQP